MAKEMDPERLKVSEHLTQCDYPVCQSHVTGHMCGSISVPVLGLLTSSLYF